MRGEVRLTVSGTKMFLCSTSPELNRVHPPTTTFPPIDTGSVESLCKLGISVLDYALVRKDLHPEEDCSFLIIVQPWNRTWYNQRQNIACVIGTGSIDPNPTQPGVNTPSTSRIWDTHHRGPQKNVKAALMLHCLPPESNRVHPAAELPARYGLLRHRTTTILRLYYRNEILSMQHPTKCENTQHAPCTDELGRDHQLAPLAHASSKEHADPRQNADIPRTLSGAMRRQREKKLESLSGPPVRPSGQSDVADMRTAEERRLSIGSV